MNANSELKIPLSSERELTVGGIEQIKEDANNSAKILVEFVSDSCIAAKKLSKVQGLDEVQIAQVISILDDLTGIWGTRLAGGLAGQLREEYNRMTREDRL